jgi:hypothetical protein
MNQKRQRNVKKVSVFLLPEGWSVSLLAHLLETRSEVVGPQIGHVTLLVCEDEDVIPVAGGPHRRHRR